MKYVAIYIKYKSNSSDPTDCTWHGWQVEADSPEQALELLEQRWDVPWRDYWLDTVEFDDLGKFRSEQLEGEQVLLHT